MNNRILLSIHVTTSNEQQISSEAFFIHYLNMIVDEGNESECIKLICFFCVNASANLSAVVMVETFVT